MICELNDNDASTVTPQYETLHSILGNAMGPSNPESLRIQAYKTTGNIVGSFVDEEVYIKAYAELLPVFMETLKMSMEYDPQEAATCFEILCAMIENCPQMFEDVFVPLLKVCVDMALNSAQYDWDTRQYALHTVETCLKLKPVWFVKNNLVLTVIDVAFQIGCEPDPEYVDDWGITPSRSASAFHDVLSRYLNPKHTYKYFMSRIEELAQSDNPIHRRAAVTALTAIADGCSEVIREELDKFIPYMQSCFNDADESVVRGVCTLLGNFSQYLTPEILDYSEILMPIILRCIYEGTEKVKEAACYSLVCYLRDLDVEQLLPYVEQLLSILVSTLMESQSADVQEMAITAIAAVSVASREHFLPHFENVINLLKQVVVITDPSRIVLRSRAIDAAGEISTVVGRDLFSPHFQFFMERAFENFSLPRYIPSKDEEEKLSNDIRESTFSFFGTIATTFADAYLPYLAESVKLIMETIQEREEAGNSLQEQLLGIVSDDDEDDDFDETKVDDDEYMEKMLKRMNYSVGLTEIDEKVSAIHCLGAIAAGVGAPFVDFIEQGMTGVNIMISSLFPSARRAALYALESFILAMNKLLPPKKEGWKPGLPLDEYALNPDVQSFIDSVVETIMNRIEIEIDLTVSTRYLESIEFIGDTFGLVALSPHMEDIVGLLASILAEETIVQAEALEEEDNEEFAQDMYVFFDQACTLVNMLGSLYKEEFFTIMTHFVKPFSVLVESKSPLKREWRHRVIAVYASLADEVDLEKVHEDFIQLFLQHALLGASDEEYAFRANSIYLLGLLCKHPFTHAYYESILEKIMVVLTTDDAPKSLDNACGAMGRAVLYAPNLVPYEAILSPWLEKLPIREEHEEDEPSYSALMALIEQGNQHIQPYIPRVVDIFTQALANPQGDGSLKEKLAAVVRMLWEKYKNEIEQVVNQLSEEQKEIFKRCLQ